ALAGAMKAKKCDAFKKVIAEFESEPSIAKLAEFAEVRSLAQYTCAIEAKEKLKSDIAAVMSAPGCRETKRLLAESRDAMEADARGKLEKLSKEVCCPEYGLGKECLTRKVALGRVVAKLEEKGCTMGRTSETKTARAMHLMERINVEGGFGLDVKANGAPLDQVW